MPGSTGPAGRSHDPCAMGRASHHIFTARDNADRHTFPPGRGPRIVVPGRGLRPAVIGRLPGCLKEGIEPPIAGTLACRRRDEARWRDIRGQTDTSGASRPAESPPEPQARCLRPTCPCSIHASLPCEPRIVGYIGKLGFHPESTITGLSCQGESPSPLGFLCRAGERTHLGRSARAVESPLLSILSSPAGAGISCGLACGRHTGRFAAPRRADRPFLGRNRGQDRHAAILTQSIGLPLPSQCGTHLIRLLAKHRPGTPGR